MEVESWGGREISEILWLVSGRVSRAEPQTSSKNNSRSARRPGRTPCLCVCWYIPGVCFIFPALSPCSGLAGGRQGGVGRESCGLVGSGSVRRGGGVLGWRSARRRIPAAGYQPSGLDAFEAASVKTTLILFSNSFYSLVLPPPPLLFL